jgi:hypothetical protein
MRNNSNKLENAIFPIAWILHQQRKGTLQVEKQKYLPGIKEPVKLPEKLRNKKAVPTTKNKTHNPESFIMSKLISVRMTSRED